MKQIKQVGGKHYEAAKPGDEHWDLMEEFDVSYLEATATKYVVRWRKKNGAEDLEKAVSYLQKMGGRASRRLVPDDRLHAMGHSYKLSSTEHMICWLVLSQGQPEDIVTALRLLQVLIDEEQSHGR